MKKYKAGSKVWLWCCTHDAQSLEQEVYVLENDMSEDELKEVASEYYYNTKEPEWGFSKTKLDEY